MSATVRSVTVRMNAEVAKYIADMRRAGRETDKAFASSTSSIKANNRELAISQQRLAGVDAVQRSVATTQSRYNTRLDTGTKRLAGFNTELGRTSTGLAGLNGGGGGGLVTLERNASRADDSINQLTGRLRLAVDAVLTLGPALVPLGAGALAGAVAMLTQIGALAGGIGVTVLALQGLGDGLKALNAYQLDPTAANLEKVQQELEALGPAGADFVYFLDSITPQLKELQNAAREGALPGFAEGIDSLLQRGPELQAIITGLSEAVGDLAADSGAGLAGSGFDSFFGYLEDRAPVILRELGESLGNVAEGLANLFVGFDPLTDAFSKGLVGITEDFAAWSRGLANNDDFQGFIDYLRTAGPQALEFSGALIRAVAGIAEAAAPIGSAVLPALTDLLDVIARLASSPLGGTLLTIAAGMAAFSRASSLASTAVGALGTSGTNTGNSLRSALKFGALVAGLALVNDAVTTLQDNLSGVDLDRSLTSIGSGGSVGDLEDIASAIEGAASAGLTAQEPISELTSGFGLLGDTARDSALKQVEDVDQALAAMVESGNGEQAAAIFDELVRGAVELRGVDASEAARQFDAYGLALENAGSAAKEAADAAPYAAEATFTLAGASRASALAARSEARALRDSVEAMLEKRNAALAGFDAETRWGQALADARKAAQNNTAGINQNTKAGRENRDTLSALAGAWNNQSAAVRNSESRFRAARSAFIETATAMGVPKRAAIELADKLLAIPKSRVVTVTAETKAASAAISRIIAQAQSIPREIRTNYIVTQTNRINRPQILPGLPPSAEGNFFPTVRAYAGGGLDRPNAHEAELYRGGVTRMWGEPETGGEAYIPLANDHRRPRAEQILELTAAELGGDVVWNALGGFDGRGGAGSRGSSLRSQADAAIVRSTQQVTTSLGKMALASTKAEKSMGAELRARTKLLEKEMERDKARADAVKQEISAIESSIKSRYEADTFNTGPGYERERPENWDELTDAQQYAFTQQEAEINRLLQRTPTQNLRDADLQLDEMEALLKQLEGMGLDGPALSALFAEGDINQIRAFASGTRRDVREYERLYESNQRRLNQFAGDVGAGARGAELRAAVAELRESREDARRARRRQEAWEKRMEEKAEKNPRRTGKAVGDAVRSSAAAGARRQTK